MRSIERRFSNLQHKRRDHSSVVNFAAAVRAQNFSKDTLSRWFNKLVESDDYARSDKRVILRYLYALNCAEGDGNKGETGFQRAKREARRVYADS